MKKDLIYILIMSIILLVMVIVVTNEVKEKLLPVEVQNIGNDVINSYVDYYAPITEGFNTKYETYSDGGNKIAKLISNHYDIEDDCYKSTTIIRNYEDLEKYLNEIYTWKYDLVDTKTNTVSQEESHFLMEDLIMIFKNSNYPIDVVDIENRLKDGFSNGMAIVATAYNKKGLDYSLIGIEETENEVIVNLGYRERNSGDIFKKANIDYPTKNYILIYPHEKNIKVNVFTKTENYYGYMAIIITYLAYYITFGAFLYFIMTVIQIAIIRKNFEKDMEELEEDIARDKIEYEKRNKFQ